jgi:ACS family glucarate transporter-like MFS transporter
MNSDAASLVPTNRRWVVFALAAATSFLLYLHRYTWNLIRPELQREYQFSNTELEAMGTAFYLSYAVGSVPSGVAIDLFGPHLFLVGIILAWSLTLPLHGATSSVLGMASVRVLFGAGQTGCYPALGQVTRAWFPWTSRTLVQGWVASFFGRGGAGCASILMGWLLLTMTWQEALIVLSIPGVLFALLFLAVFRNSPAEDRHVNAAELALIRGDDPVGVEARGVIPVKTAMRNRTLRVMLGQQVLDSGSDVVYTLVTGSYFVSLGVTEKTELGWFVSLPLWGGALGGITAGFLNDRMIRAVGSRWGRSLVASCGKLLATGSLVFAISQPTPEKIAYGLFIVKFFTDWSQPTVWGTCTDIGGRFSATVFSIINMAGNVGALLTPFVIGPLLDAFTVKQTVAGKLVSTTNFTPMFVLVGTMYLGSAVCWLFVDCTRRLEEHESVSE